MNLGGTTPVPFNRREQPLCVLELERRCQQELESSLGHDECPTLSHRHLRDRAQARLWQRILPPVGVGTSHRGHERHLLRRRAQCSAWAPTTPVCSSTRVTASTSSRAGAATPPAVRTPSRSRSAPPRSVTATYGTEHKLTLATNCPGAVGIANLTGGSEREFLRRRGSMFSLSATTPVAFNVGNSQYLISTTGAAAPPAPQLLVSVTMSGPKDAHSHLRDPIQGDACDQSGMASASSGTSERGHERGPFYDAGSSPTLSNSSRLLEVARAASASTTGRAKPPARPIRRP